MPHCAMSLLCGQTRQTCFGTFIRRRHKTTRQATDRIILVMDVYTRNIISCRDRKRIHLDKSAFILFPQNDLAPEKATCHLLSSPTQFPWLRQLWGLRPMSSSTSTEAPDFSSSATTSSRPSCAARCSGVRPRPGEAATTLAPLDGKLASCASCASLKSHSPTQTLHAI